MLALLITGMLLQAPDCRPVVEPDSAIEPSLVVQVVDPIWLPVPGAQVSVLPGGEAEGCFATETNKQGYARFWLPRRETYSVKVHLLGFEEAVVPDVLTPGLNPTYPSACVQVRLEVDDSNQVPLH